MKKIPLTKNKFALVDDEDFEWLNQWKWHVNGRGYAARSGVYPIPMHTDIMQTPDDMECDHINGNRLDNRRENLRVCTSQENGLNRRVYKNNTSGYKGVNFQCGRWRAKITYMLKQRHLGYFDTAEEAARVYDKEARLLYKGFAHLNFPEA